MQNGPEQAPEQDSQQKRDKHRFEARRLFSLAGKFIRIGGDLVRIIHFLAQFFGDL
ncbi:hypothetical protein [Streptomyces sp. NPDC002250]|uniref:hypothetical protein n=1 Tax=Streptomyces sp. NPDC002250 TaxID=3364641 RepID=UPI003681FDE5